MGNLLGGLGFGGCSGEDNSIWIIIIIVLLLFCNNNNGFLGGLFGNNCECREGRESCENNDFTWIIIVIVILLLCNNNNNNCSIPDNECRKPC